MSMRKLGSSMLFFTTVLFGNSLHADTLSSDKCGEETYIDYTKDNKPLGIYNIDKRLENQYKDSVLKTIGGKIIKLDYNDQEKQIVGFTIENGDGRIKVNVDNQCMYAMNNFNRRWIPHIIQNGSYVSVDVFQSTSNIFTAKNIIVEKLVDEKLKFDSFVSNKENIVDGGYYITTDLTLDMAVDFCKKHFGTREYYFMNRRGNVSPEYKTVECSKDGKSSDSKDNVYIVFKEEILLDKESIKYVIFSSFNSVYQYQSDDFINLMKSFSSHLKIVRKDSPEEKKIIEVLSSDYKKKKEMNLHYSFIIEHDNVESKYLYETLVLNTYYDCFYYKNPSKYVIMGDLLDTNYSILTANEKSQKKSNQSKYLSYIKDDRLYIDFII